MSLVDSFMHLSGRPKSDRALPLLQRIASLVKPVMRKHSWRLPVLAEFFPDEPSLLGQNMNSGQKILLRLRPPWSPDTFYGEEQLVSVMLHELTHNVHGPHDDKFYKYLSDLEAEYDALRLAGYDGEGFHTAGKRLGAGVSHNIPPSLARSKALQSAEKRRAIQKVLGSSGGQRLGGRLPTRSSIHMSPRELAVEAAEQRARDEKSCGTSKESAHREAERAASDSVEDKDPAALTILEDDQTESHAVGVSQSTAGAAANEDEWPCVVCTLDNLPSTSRCLACLSARPQLGKDPSMGETIVSTASPSRTSLTSTAFRNIRLAATSPAPNKLDKSVSEVSWTCPTCTLHNSGHFLQCEACSTMRPDRVLKDSWTCIACGEDGMPHNFWSCRLCGWIKESS